MSNTQRKMDQKNIFKELVSQYQKQGYSIKEARRYASQEVDELMIEKKLKPRKRKVN